jgi:hypothetical protein
MAEPAHKQDLAAWHACGHAWAREIFYPCIFIFTNTFGVIGYRIIHPYTR